MRQIYGTNRPPLTAKRIIGIFLFVVVVYYSVRSIAEFYVEFKWFESYNQLKLFWTLFYGKFFVGLLFFFIFIGLFVFNFVLLRITGGSGRIFSTNILNKIRIPLFKTPRRALFVIFVIIAIGVVLVGFFMAMVASSYWQEFLLYLYSSPFEHFPADPVFNNDISFYVFSLPFYSFAYHWIFGALVILLVFSTLYHLFNESIFSKTLFEISPFARAHLSILAALLVFVYGIGYRLSAYELLFNERVRFFGAGYADIHAKLFGYNICMVLTIVAAGLLLFNIVKKSLKLPLIVLIALIPANLLFGTVYPFLLQRFVVEPNELERETPYISHNIRFTRLAFGLDKIEEREFLNDGKLTYRDILNNKDTLENIRLWDWRPLKSSYKQLQLLKPYYYFHDVDVDRYVINGRKIAVNLSARELISDKLGQQSKSWQNQHLIYTHGYGLVMSRVDKVTVEGMPEFLVYDIPPKTTINLKIERPEIYYGEYDKPYVIVKTNISPGEFDYPYGAENKYTRYEGKGGVQLGSFISKVLFAVAFGDINILISKSITPESRILYNRNIIKIVSTLTPFLGFDDDPYLVVINGKLYWFIDAYTYSNRFPYSTQVRLVDGKKINYIRNSIKIIIDAYEGTAQYYLCDPSDPIAKTYLRMFPELLRPFEEMPNDFKQHIRYPEDLFNIQSMVLLRYHMTNVNVFYNNEDMWAFAKQIYEDQEELVHSYYFITRLPGEDRSEFLLTIPFTPLRRDNMIAFLVAKCDLPQYGKMILYSLPKDKLNYGPMQIEARINQDPEISKLLTLWSQRGSSVIRGNMLVIPIEKSILMIEPLYLKAENSEMPELRRVFVSFTDKVVMEENLDHALETLFSGKRFGKGHIEGLERNESIVQLAKRAYYHFLQAEKSQKDGNWAKYGEELKNLKEILEIIKDRNEK
ncbi:MAG: UPF0182 family protein [Spirochaetes bacterium]|nr:UPF0182 family protein [Spirochaetota bacterium]